MGYGGGVSPVQVLLVWFAACFCMALAGAYTMDPSDPLRRHEDARLRAERILSAVSAGVAPSLPVTTSASPSRVYYVTEYGADPTGTTDSTDAIARAISDASRPPSDRFLFVGIANLDGAEIHLGGGTYLVNRPIAIPPSAGNLKVQLPSSFCVSKK
ncbi:hypothetical protein HPP92_004197 [Vanilla planifolia]|uniref:Rhamnogalacturonase A/B/Epimerase-like pectate lyase domain-containing protein n=1 Tax=Vanilla planifolia TaxID=51239 RepID=A0A835RWB3_VANPL|nr:hypothetical protein HPP92_004197 [Vanilla planifolia]